jgi:putative sugar O-methyltransferase
MKKLIKKILNIFGFSIHKVMPRSTGLLFFPNSDLAAVSAEFEALTSRHIAANPQWNNYQERILQDFLRDPNNFLRSKFIAQTMHHAHYELSNRCINQMLRSVKSRRYLSLLSESPVGNPITDLSCPSSSPAMIQQVHHLMKIEEAFGNLRTFDRIVDIGGGYGGFTKVVKKLGFTGEYVVYDLPVMHRIQDIYLRAVFGFSEDVATIDKIKRYTKPSNLLEDLKSTPLRTLLVATWSLSEMPMLLRDELLAVMPYVNSAFIAFQRDFGGIDNINYFHEKFTESKNTKIVQQEVFDNNFYLFVGVDRF